MTSRRKWVLVALIVVAGIGTLAAQPEPQMPLDFVPLSPKEVRELKNDLAAIKRDVTWIRRSLPVGAQAAMPATVPSMHAAATSASRALITGLQKCIGCHNATDGLKAKGGHLVLFDADNDFIKPKSKQQAERICRAIESGDMPKGGELTREENAAVCGYVRASAPVQ